MVLPCKQASPLLSPASITTQRWFRLNLKILDPFGMDSTLYEVLFFTRSMVLVVVAQAYVALMLLGKGGPGGYRMIHMYEGQ